MRVELLVKRRDLLYGCVGAAIVLPWSACAQTRAETRRVGIDAADLVARAATCVDRILRGEKAGNLPIQAPTKYEITLNQRTAAAIGLTLPPSLLSRADEVIE
jgi:hypothetical protein